MLNEYIGEGSLMCCCTYEDQRGQNKMLTIAGCIKTPNKQDDASSCPESLVAAVGRYRLSQWFAGCCACITPNPPPSIHQKHCEPTLRNSLVVQMHGDMHDTTSDHSILQAMAAPYVVLQTGHCPSLDKRNTDRTTLNAIRKTLG